MHVLIIILVIALIIAVCFALSNKSTANKNAENAAILTQRVSSLQADLEEKKKVISDLQDIIKDYEARIVIIEDEYPDEDTLYNRAMKLTNEIVPFIVDRNGKIALYIFNKKPVD